MPEINLMKNYPRAKRDILKRANHKSQRHQNIARKFDKEFFDGSRATGYGGFSYNAKYWKSVVADFKNHYGINQYESVLDVGCAKGFMLVDLKKAIPGLSVSGIDISHYAVSSAHNDVVGRLMVSDCAALPFADKSFDYVFSITTLHNHAIPECIRALQEIQRVARKGAFITVDAYRTENEKQQMLAWNLTAKTILHVDEWRRLFELAGYSHDYYWFMP